MTVIALDDEPLALVLIEKYLRELADVELLSTFSDTTKAIQFLQNNPVDLLLSDINMPDINGLQLVSELVDERPMVIFVTAYKEYAHIGFDLEVIDYLVKPVAPQRFEKAIQKAKTLFNLTTKSVVLSAPTLEDHFFVYADYQQIRINIQEITFIEGMGDYVKIYLDTRSKPVFTLERMKNLTAKLELHGFKRIHRSFLVNWAKVQSKQKSQVLITGVWIPVGETYVKGI